MDKTDFFLSLSHFLWNFFSAHSWKNIDTPLDTELGVCVCCQSLEIFFSRNIWNRDILRASICAYRHKLSFLLKKIDDKTSESLNFWVFQKKTHFFIEIVHFLKTFKNRVLGLSSPKKIFKNDFSSKSLKSKKLWYFSSRMIYLHRAYCF